MTATTGRNRLVVAIDGPAGAGKSTLAKYLARRFDLLNLETGAMYRAFALKAIETATQLDDEPALMRLAERTEIVLDPRPNDSNRVRLDGVDVTERVRERDITEAASRISVHPSVRAWMVARQRAMGVHGGVVMEGRDIGTHVFPDAELKIFLDAADQVRGERRFLQDNKAGSRGEEETRTQEAVLAAVRERDTRDKNRVASPLAPAPDAIHLDTSQMTLDDVCRRAEELVLSKIKSS